MEHNYNLSVINELLPVLTSGNTGVWVYNTTSKQLDFKNDFFNILSLTRLGIEFSSIDELLTLLHADDVKAFNEAFAAALAGKNRSVTYRCRKSEDADMAQLETTLMPCAEGVVACTVNKNMQQMASWEKQYRTLVNALFPNFIFVFDENFHYLDVIVPDGMRLFHTREELIGQDARQYYTPEVSELLISNIRECLRTNQCKEVEHHIMLHDARYYYQIRIVPVDGDKAFCLVRDIGDRVRRMDELIAQRQRAEESDRLKSVFIANISHEIRTPLNAIVGLSELLDGEAPEKRQEYINIIRKNNNTLLEVINNILEMSRIEAGMSEFNFEITDVVDLVKKTAEQYIYETKPHVRLRTDIADTDIQVFTDAGRVGQVLDNLLSNAVKYTEYGAITLKVEKTDDNLIFSVADTGCGIPEDKLETIFNRFEKLNSFIQGAGLGLSLSAVIAERLGGKITVASKVGEGSIFSFSIPYRHDLSDTKCIGSVCELYADQRKKIMVFETVESDMKYLCEILDKKYCIIGITDTEKIISSFILDQPNLIVVNMQVAERKDIISKLRAITPSIPIIAMTTSDFYHDQRLALDNGCTDVIAKPFSPTRMEEMVIAFIV